MTKATSHKFIELIQGTSLLAQQFVKGSDEYNELATALACIGRARRIALERPPPEEAPVFEEEP